MSNLKKLLLILIPLTITLFRTLNLGYSYFGILGIICLFSFYFLITYAIVHLLTNIREPAHLISYLLCIGLTILLLFIDSNTKSLSYGNTFWYCIHVPPFLYLLVSGFKRMNRAT